MIIYMMIMLLIFLLTFPLDDVPLPIVIPLMVHHFSMFLIQAPFFNSMMCTFIDDCISKGYHLSK
jgi:hypothetical protein